MAHHKKIYTQHDYHTVRQEPGNMKHPHYTISANNNHQDINERVGVKNDRKVDNKIFYQFNLDDWQG